MILALRESLLLTDGQPSPLLGPVRPCAAEKALG